MTQKVTGIDSVAIVSLSLHSCKRSLWTQCQSILERRSTVLLRISGPHPIKHLKQQAEHAVHGLSLAALSTAIQSLGLDSYIKVARVKLFEIRDISDQAGFFQKAYRESARKRAWTRLQRHGANRRPSLFCWRSGLL